MHWFLHIYVPFTRCSTQIQIELSTASTPFARFKFVYFFLALAEQFGFYWISLYGAEQFGWEDWLNRYIIFHAIASFISIFSSPILGRLSDRYGRKGIILLSIFFQCLPYVPMSLYPDEVSYFLYALPVIGICGSISPTTGVMKAFVVDTLPKKFLISGFAKLISIYAGAGILSSILIYSVIGNEGREYFYEDDLLDFTTQLIMLTTIGLFIITAFMFALIVPETLSVDEYKMKYLKTNPCHGISHSLSNTVLTCSALFIFFTGFAQMGMLSIIEDIFLIDFDTSDYTNRIDLFTATSEQDTSISATDIPKAMSGDLAVYAAFLFTMGCTLIIAPCCIRCCCSNAATSMIYAMILMIISFGLTVFILISDEWYAFIVSLFCGLLFAMGQIGMTFLDGFIAKYMNSKQYGINYGLLHSVYSLARAAAPYCFFLLFELFTTRDSSPNELLLGNAKPVVYVAILLTIIGLLIALFGIKRSVKKYEEVNKNISKIKKSVASPHNYSTNDARFEEGVFLSLFSNLTVCTCINTADHGMKDKYEPQKIQNRQNRAPSAPEEHEVEMQPPPQQYAAHQQQYPQQMMQQQYIQPYAASSSHSHVAYAQYQQPQPVYSNSADYAPQQAGHSQQYGGYGMSDRV